MRALRALARRVSASSLISHEQLARLTFVDYNREMAFIASGLRDDGKRETLGVVRGISDPDNVQVQMAIIVRSDVKGRGLGHALLEKLVRYFQKRGAREMIADTTAANRRMLALARGLGFELQESDDRQTVWMRRRL